MNYSYLMGVKDVSELVNAGFVIEQIDDDYGVKFTKEQENKYEEFVVKNLEPGYWNEYLGDNIVFIFKYPNNEIKKFILDDINEREILNLCCEFAECDFSSLRQMLEENSFYEINYFNRK